MNLDTVKATIRKLLNLANDESAAKGEVENAMRFASRLMEQHQLSDEDLTEVDDVLLDLERKECSREIAFTGGVRMSDWEMNVASFAAKLVGGVKFYASHPAAVRENGIVKLDTDGTALMRSRVVFYGIAEDVELARQVFSEAIVTIAAMGRLKWGGVYRGAGRNYCEGFAIGLLNQLHVAREHERKESTGTALIVIQNRNAIVERKEDIATKWLESEGIKLGTRHSSNSASFNGDAYGEGKSDGSKHTPAAERRAKITGPK